MQTVEAHC